MKRPRVQLHRNQGYNAEQERTAAIGEAHRTLSGTRLFLRLFIVQRYGNKSVTVAVNSWPGMAVAASYENYGETSEECSPRDRYAYGQETGQRSRMVNVTGRDLHA